MTTRARIFEPKLTGTLSPDNSRYLRAVLRMKPGDSFCVTDGAGAEISAVLKDGEGYGLGEATRPDREAKFQITLFVAVSKGDRFETVIEKGVELGATRIVPLLANRCVAKTPSEGKRERWEKIAVSAMLQCGGCIHPLVEEPRRVSELPVPGPDTAASALHESLTKSSFLLPLSSTPKQLWIASGPEGGFDESELDAFQTRQWKLLWLGNRLFRADTAPIAALAAILLGRSA